MHFYIDIDIDRYKYSMHMHIRAEENDKLSSSAQKKSREIGLTLKMGLFNWIHDRRVVDLQNQLKLLASDIKVLQAHQDLLETKFNSVNAKVSRKALPKEEEHSDENDLEELVKAFGGELPFELRQKYKKQ